MFTISQHKLAPPTRKLTFLDIELDTVACSMTLPQEKLHECQAVISSFLHKRRATKNQLQRLADKPGGKLNWACRVVYGGRTFLRRVLDTMTTISPGAKHRLTAPFYHEIAWWVNFLQVFNGKHLFLDDRPTVDVMTDSCSLAAGGYFGGDWFYFDFSLHNPNTKMLSLVYTRALIFYPSTSS